jgi:hypothetical protein
MKMKLTLIIGCMAFMMGSHLMAQDGPKFTVEVSSDSILMNNYFTVSFTLENAEGANFMPPAFDEFEVASGPNTSSSMSIMNGKVSQKVTYTYYLRPRDIGNYFIEPASIESDEGVLETLPREVIVLPNPDGIIQQPKPRTESFNFNSSPFFGPDMKMEGMEDLQKLFPSLEELQKNMQEFFPRLDLMPQQEGEGDGTNPEEKKKRKRKKFKM